MRIVAIPFACALAVGAAGCGPHASEMTTEDAAGLSDSLLCSWYADHLDQGFPAPAVVAEYERRDLSCDTAIARVVEDCSRLEIISAEAHPRNRNVQVFEVRSRFDDVRDFRIAHNGMSSETLTIGPNTTERLGFVRDPRMQVTRALLSAAGVSGSGPVPKLYDCHASRRQ